MLRLILFTSVLLVMVMSLSAAVHSDEMTNSFREGAQQISMLDKLHASPGRINP
jgi:hypothetical protein